MIITRLSNVYGLHQSKDKIIPKFIALLKENKKVTVYGDGNMVRTYSHVYDVTNAIDLIILKGAIGETYQIDNKVDECNVLEIAKGLILLMVNVKFETDEDFEPYIEYVTDPSLTATTARYYVSNDKLKKLGWVSEIPFIEGIVELIKLN